MRPSTHLLGRCTVEDEWWLAVTPVVDGNVSSACDDEMEWKRS